MATVLQDTTELSGLEQFQLARKKLISGDSLHEINLANTFNALREVDQQIWLKAAKCPLVKGFLYSGGGRVRNWSQLDKQQRQRMMSAHRSICAIARAYL
jgi:hypothetical protein